MEPISATVLKFCDFLVQPLAYISNKSLIIHAQAFGYENEAASALNMCSWVSRLVSNIHVLDKPVFKHLKKFHFLLVFFFVLHILTFAAFFLLFFSDRLLTNNVIHSF